MGSIMMFWMVKKSNFIDTHGKSMWTQNIDIGGERFVKTIKQAHGLVHNLKGLAGNLEATGFQAAAVKIEKLVKGQTT